MAEETGISWCDHTFNPWIGCTKVSPACDHCYAEQVDKRFGGGHWGPHAPRRRTSVQNWNLVRRWNRKAIAAGSRRRVFVASLADVFDNAIDPEWRADLWALISECQGLDFLLLTKRPQNIARMLPEGWGPDGWSNVWLGTTAEDQTRLADRAWMLAQVPAGVRFLSVEPMLGPIDTRHVTNRWGTSWDVLTGRILHAVSGPVRTGAIGWVICGGESGDGARAMASGWARSLRDQCKAADVPFFFKQWGEWAPSRGHPSETPGRFAFGNYEDDAGRMIQTDHYPRQFTMFGARSIMEWIGKKTAGDLLDGVQHHAWPATLCPEEARRAE